MIRKGVLLVLAMAVLAVAGLYARGLALPATSRATRDISLAAPPAEIHARISDIKAQASWRRDIGRITLANDGASWTEFAHDGSAIHFRRIASRPGALFVIGYTSSLGFEGTWRVTLVPTPGGTRAQFAEAVTIANPLMRAIGQLASPPGQHLDLYLADLRRALGS
jgi:hypothetical protein